MSEMAPSKRSVWPSRLGAVGLLCFLTPWGCSHRNSSDASPENAVRSFLEHMEASMEDPSQLQLAFELLGPESKGNLEERAQRMVNLTGRRVEPLEMLAPGRFGLRFRPKDFRSDIQGDRAVVQVSGAEPFEWAAVRCSRVPYRTVGREVWGWRIEPELPPVGTQQAR